MGKEVKIFISVFDQDMGVYNHQVQHIEGVGVTQQRYMGFKSNKPFSVPGDYDKADQ